MPLSSPIHRLKKTAKLRARAEGIPLHAALDQIAVREGFRSWSHLSSSEGRSTPAQQMLKILSPGDLALIGARPGHGKTLLGLQVLLEAANDGKSGTFFTLEYNPEDVAARLEKLGGAHHAGTGAVSLDFSDSIWAGYICDVLAKKPSTSLAVVDYMQLLDQRREHPPLADQLNMLKTFCLKSGHITVLISQIDRAFDASGKHMPDSHDIRLPNPADLGLLSATCFLHEGKHRIARAAALP